MKKQRTPFRPAPLVAAMLLTGAAAAQPPVITAVANSASYEASVISPGTLVIVWGERLGPDELESAVPGEDGLLADTLAGTRVYFNDTPAPLLYASATQVAAVTPVSLSPGSPVTVRAEYQGLSEPFVVPVVPTSPGIFTLDASGRGGAVALNESGAINAPDEPAAANSELIFYITGAGQTEPLETAGGAARGAWRAVAQPVAVAIGGAEAAVVEAVAAPLMVPGVSRIRVQVPPDAPSGGHAFLSVQVGGTEAQHGVTVAVTGTPQALPAPPAPPAVSVPEPGRVEVALSGPVPEDALHVRLERSTSPSDGFTEIAVLPTTDPSYADTSVAPSATYYYRARFETAAGFTGPSGAVPASTPPQAPAPADFRAVAGSHSEVKLEWSATGEPGTMRIERKTPSGNWREIATVPRSAGSYRNRGLTPGTVYTYRVRSEAGGALSAYAEASVRTPAFKAAAGPPSIHPAESRRLRWNGGMWYPVGYYPAVGALTSDQYDYANFYRRLLDRLADNKIDYMRAVFTMGQPYGDSMTVYQRTGPGLAADGRPKFDLTRFNQTYFDYWRAVAVYAYSKGIVLQLCIYDLWHNRDMIVQENSPARTWGMKYDFYYGENNINGVSTANHTEWMNADHPVFGYHQALVRKLVDTMGDLPNIVWEIGNETGRTDWEERMADFLTEYERSRGLPVRLVIPRDLPGHQLVPGQCVADPVEVHTGLVADYSRNVPLITDNDCIDAGNADARRRRAWAAFTAGAHISLFHFELGRSGVLDSQDALDGMRYLGYLRTFVDEMGVNLLGMRPSDNLVSNGWAYAQPGREYIIYLITGGSTTVSGLPGAYDAVWFDPRSGRTQTAGAGPVFTAPDTNDWVLYIRARN